MQYQLLFTRNAPGGAQQTGGVTYADGITPLIPAIGESVEFLVSAGPPVIVAAGAVTGISYNYQDTTGQLIVVTITAT